MKLTKELCKVGMTFKAGQEKYYTALYEIVELDIYDFKYKCIKKGDSSGDVVGRVSKLDYTMLPTFWIVPIKKNIPKDII